MSPPRIASMTPELLTLRRAVERDRYGLMAYVLAARDHCTPSQCAAFRALTDNHQIVANMDERVYDGLIARYAPSWNAPAATASAGGRACTIDADRETHQCRFSLGSLDPACQHHDAGTGRGGGAIASRPPASSPARMRQCLRRRARQRRQPPRRRRPKSRLRRNRRALRARSAFPTASASAAAAPAAANE